jgi:hypothetical protein
LLAARVFDDSETAARSFTWGEHRIAANTWHTIARAKADFADGKPAAKPRARRPRAKKNSAKSTALA